MYPTTHGHTGVIITTASVMTCGVLVGLPLGLALSFVSHFLWDYVGEYAYKNWIKQQAYSVLIFILCLGFLYTKGEYLFVVTYVFGYLAGNSPDIIDKKIWIKPARPLKKRFSCHNGDSFLSIGKWKLGIMKYPITKTQNRIIQLIFTVAIVILTIII